MMKRHDSEVISTTSSTSKGSERRKNRFSLRRIFYSGRTGRAKSHISLNSNSSTHSESSFAVVDKDHNDATKGAYAAVLPQARPSIAEVETVEFPASSPTATTVSGESMENGSEKVRECPLCLMEHPSENFPEISTCYHRSCLNCLRMYLRIEITESRVNIACPECAEKFHPNDIRDIVQDNALMTKYEDFMVRRVLVSDPDARWCPAPDCGYAVIAKECAGCPKIKCERPGCDTHFCYHCKQYWHPNKTCDAARAERLLETRAGSITYSHETESQKDFIKPCPRCSAFIMKMNDGSCNHMTCPVCGAEFCWLCMKEISDLHYLSPSGCTFWGKKPWSRKKKILWQLGTLVGAPVGITLLAGIAVPAMIIGIPVWVGRKIHSKYEMSPRHRRNLVIAGGVFASVLVSPILAGLAVGIGVPILLGYVYGVVPISLCRSGGCGVRTTNSGGVRFEFEENETGIPSSMYPGIDSQSVGTGNQVPNPSIAPSIGEASVGMTNSLYSASSSHIDRMGITREESDRDSASNRAIAGASLNGSMCGSTYAAVIGMHTKLEVQAELETDVPTGKRASFSSDSANFSIEDKSLGDKSTLGDDASTRGLAGSLANYRMDTVSITTASEVIPEVSKRSSSGVTKYPGSLCKGGEMDQPQGRDLERTTPSPRDGEVNSIHSGASSDDKKKTASCPGSPISGCGSMCDHDEAGSRPHALRCRKCRRVAKMTASEQMNVHFSDQVSLQSFQADDAVLDLPMGKHDIDSLSEMCNENESESDDALERSANGGYRVKVKPVIRNNSEPAIVMTEVESDRPRFKKVVEKDVGACESSLSRMGRGNLSGNLSSPRGRQSDDSSDDMLSSLNSFTSSTSMRFCKGDLPSQESVLSKCRSEETFKHRGNARPHTKVGEKCRSEEICNMEKSPGAVGGVIKRVRRKSCELAIENGRISPSPVKDK